MTMTQLILPSVIEALTDTQLKEEYEAVWEKVMSDVDRNDLLEFAH